MFRLAIITALLSGACAGHTPLFQVLAIIPHGSSPPLVDITDTSKLIKSSQDDMSTSSSQYYPTIEEYDDYRGKRESDELHPEAYLKPPSEDASTPLWQDGNNWDLGYDPSEILSPPMPLSMGIPYDTIKLSSDDANVMDVNEAQGSSPHRQETRPNKPRSHKPKSYKKRQPARSSQSQRYSDYEDNRPFSNKRPSKYTDYEDAPVRPSKRQTFRGGFPDSYNDYDEPPSRRQPASFSFSQTDQNGHFKWGVRHHQ